MLSIYPLPCLDTNYIWVLQEGRLAVAVDPGEALPLIQHLQQNGLELAGVLITHRHADHIGGLPALQAHTPTPVYGPASIAGVTDPVQDGDTLNLLGVDWQILATPGHTDEHITYYGAGALFCGDVIFGAGCGRLFDGTPAEMFESIQRLNTLPSDTLIYCAHEYTLANLRFAAAVEPNNPAIALRIKQESEKTTAGLPTVPSTLALEQATNPFLRCLDPDVIRSAQHRDPAAHTPVDFFAALREWKNHFQ